MRIAIVLPGLHRVFRGAEIAFEALATELSQYQDTVVTLFGSGQERPNALYQFRHIDCVHREKFESFWPKGIPIFRDETHYEELTFAVNLMKEYIPENFDISITCAYPFMNWFLQWRRGKRYPLHVFITQNSDYMVYTNHREYRFFNCDGLVCTNPEYFERNRQIGTWQTTLIPNGVDLQRFHPGERCRAQFNLPEDAQVVLMVSALVEEKRVIAGIESVAQTPDLHLVVCGDGPQRDLVVAKGLSLMGDRFHLKQLSYAQMPEMYRAADVFLHLNMNEPFGNVYLEALATGLPIVAHDREVTRWIVGDNEWLVDSNQSSAIVEALRNALEVGREPDRVTQRLEEANRRFAWGAVGRQYYDFLQGIFQGGVST